MFTRIHLVKARRERGTTECGKETKLEFSIQLLFDGEINFWLVKQFVQIELMDVKLDS
jgi:hypothetical protein